MNTEAATSGKGQIKSDPFQSFVRGNDAALRQIFTPEEVANLAAIAADLQRSNRSLSAVRILGQSNTAQDLASLQNGQPSILRRLLVQGVGAIGGAAAGMATATGATLPAMAGWLGVKTVAAFRDAGMTHVDQIVRDAMLNPELAKALLAKVPEKAGPAFQDDLAAIIRRATAVGATTAMNGNGDAASRANADAADDRPNMPAGLINSKSARRVAPTGLINSAVR